jgi:predicted GH43/DUF377 family glycosyl hydrolase
MVKQDFIEMNVKRTNVILKSDIKRVLLRPFYPTIEERVTKIIKRIQALSEADVGQQIQDILADFEHRHRGYKSFLLKRFEQLGNESGIKPDMSENRKMLIGAYFTMEYAIEAASLFNPSMVWHPDQSNLPINSKRFILSLRATGEGHISSLAFRSGTIDSKFDIIIDPTDRFVAIPECELIGKGEYVVQFFPQQSLSERVLFPFMSEESHGIEDARFLVFQESDENTIYYATYTAYDGKSIHTMLLETVDFLQFKIKKLQGLEIKNKNLALFPRKISGQYVMLSRQDNENNYLMYSDDICCWDRKKLILEPKFTWEFFQIGNCGCPIETSEGWLVLAHGVGAMRKYVISAFLLDLDNPKKVIRRLKKPLLVSDESEREGYVPNVVYTCGGQIYNSHLVFPYAMSDYACSFAFVNLNELLDQLKHG